MSIDYEGLPGPQRTNLRPGDLSRNYLGDNSPRPIHQALSEGAYEDSTPEMLLIWKERWQIVTGLVNSNPETAPFLEWAIDHFSGYSFQEIGEKYGVSKNMAQYRVSIVLEHLRKKIRGHQF